MDYEWDPLVISIIIVQGHVGIAKSSTTHQIDGWNPTNFNGDGGGMVFMTLLYVIIINPNEPSPSHHQNDIHR